MQPTNVKKSSSSLVGHQRNSNQNHIEIPSHMLEWQSLKNQETTDGEDVEKQECFYTVRGSVNSFNHCGRWCGNSSRIQNQKYHLTQQSPYWVYTQKIINHSTIKTHAHMSFLATLFKIVKTWNQPKCSSMIDWIKKMWHILHHGIRYSHKKNEIMSFAGTWMELEAIILSKLTQEQKAEYHMFSLINWS